MPLTNRVVVAALVLVITELAKKKGGLETKICPFFAAVLGIALGLVEGFVFARESLVAAGGEGLLLGLVSMGIFDVAKGVRYLATGS